MPTRSTQPVHGKTPVPVHWHDSAWRPRVIIRFHRPRFVAPVRCSPNAPTPRFVSLASHAQALAPLPPRRRGASVSVATLNHQPSALHFSRRLTFIFSRLPCYPVSRLSQLTRL